MSFWSEFLCCFLFFLCVSWKYLIRFSIDVRINENEYKHILLFGFIISVQADFLRNTEKVWLRRYSLSQLQELLLLRF